MLAVGSIHQLTVVSGERCLLVLKPFLAKKIFLRHKVMVVVGVYISALLITAPPLLGWSRFKRDIGQHYCGFDYTSRDIASRSYLAYLFIGAYVIPCAIIIVSYVIIFRVVLQSDRRRLSIPTSRQYAAVEGTSKSDQRRQLKIAKLMLIVISAFLISWTPYACVAVIWQFVAADSSPHPDIVHAAAIFGKMFVIWNPIIYGLKDRNFRRQLCFCRPTGWRRASSVDDGAIFSHSATMTKKNSRLNSVFSDVHPNINEERSTSASLISPIVQYRHYSDCDVSVLLRSGADIELQATDV
uniref:G-protein coupled receptors family 1 profile domain-containing protein n=1 Tax=Plectus sambesii TaxID=2011161 RepID=A0A914WBT5_9BILA